MRTLTLSLLACIVLVSFSIHVLANEPFALDELHLIHWEDIPEGKPSFTGPVSAAILMAWYAERGYPELLPDFNDDGRIDEDDTRRLAAEFAQQMGGDTLEDQLADPFIVYPLARYVGARYPDEFRLLIHDESFPEEVEFDLGQLFVPTEIPGIVMDVREDPFYELYVHYLQEWRPGIVGIGPDMPAWNHFGVSRSYIPNEEPEGWPVDLVSTSYTLFAPEPIWNTWMRFEPERWGFLTPEWELFETLIVLVVDDGAFGIPGEPGDVPGGDPGNDPGGDPGGDPGDDPFDPGGGDQPRYPGQPGGEPGDDPGGDPRFPGTFDGGGVCCLPDGSCDSTFSARLCESVGGTFTFGGNCNTVDCPPPTDDPCAAVEGEITDICYTYENGVLKVFASYAIHNYGPVQADDITAYALVGLNDGVNGLGGGPECQDWQYGLDIPAGTTYTFDRVFSTSAPNLDLNNLTYLYGSLWLQVEAPWDCWPITKQAFVQTWDPAPLCNPPSNGDPGTPPGGSSDGAQSADLVTWLTLVDPANDPVAADSKPQYNLVYSNIGPDTARDVTLRLTLPTEVASYDNGLTPIQVASRPPNDIIEWHVGDLASGASQGVWFQVDIDDGICGPIVLQCQVSSTTPDPDMSNNSDALTTQVGPCDEGGTPPGGEGEPSGACCLPSGQCIETGITDCDTRGGEYRGEGSSCEGTQCGPGGSEGACPAIVASVDDACYTYNGPNSPLLVSATLNIQNFGTAVAQTPWFEVKATYEIVEGEVTTIYEDVYSGYVPDIPAGATTSFDHVFNLGLVPQEPTDGILVLLLSRISSPCIDNTETTGSNYTTLRCPVEDDGTGEPGEPDPEPDPQPDPEPEPGPGAKPNLWVTDMTGCWTWSDDGQEHVVATVTGVVHNGGQADATNVKARIKARNQSTTVTVGSIPAGGTRTVSATMDIGAYGSFSWPVSTSIEADPYDAISEADESNNTTNSSFPESSECN